jgi:hypothetical protein
MSNDTESKSATAWDDIRRMADEVRLKLHLAGMEAKEKWSKLEPQIIELENKVKSGVKDGGGRAASAVGDQVEALAGGLRQFADELRESVKKK